MANYEASNKGMAALLAGHGSFANSKPGSTATSDKLTHTVDDAMALIRELKTSCGQVEQATSINKRLPNLNALERIIKGIKKIQEIVKSVPAEQLEQQSQEDSSTSFKI